MGVPSRTFVTSATIAGQRQPEDASDEERNVGNAAEYEFIAQRDRSQRAFLARYRAFPNSKRGFSTLSLIQLDDRTPLETWYGEWRTKRWRRRRDSNPR
jgi:hypothetical protein